MVSLGGLTVSNLIAIAANLSIVHMIISWRNRIPVAENVFGNLGMRDGADPERDSARIDENRFGRIHFDRNRLPKGAGGLFSGWMGNGGLPRTAPRHPLVRMTGMGPKAVFRDVLLYNPFDTA